MADRLLQILAFANVPAAGNVTLPHQININNVAQAPDFVALDTSGFSAVITPTTCTVTNNTNAPASVNVWLELKHSVPRQIGTGPTGLSEPSLSPRPFIAATGSPVATVSAPRLWTYPKVNGSVDSGVPFLTVSNFLTLAGKRYTFTASGSWFGQADNPGDVLDLSMFVTQDTGKSAVDIVHESALVPSQPDSDASCNLAGQGSIVGDGNVHTYTMYVFWNEAAVWASVTGGGAQTLLTIIESDDQQP